MGHGGRPVSDVTSARIGVLLDYVSDGGGFDQNFVTVMQMVVDDYRERGVLDRPVEFVVRSV